ncbi:neo-calmodulin-like [Babylonia areolata]|uniref:neo-calmodulin-like n=1 Tax=Babylonia areolata TaxID=304850 RepID=UPI003FD4FFC3
MAEIDGLTQAEADELRDAFSMFDKNGDGKIGREELGAVLRALGRNPTKKEVDTMMSEADTDQSGYLSYEEYEEVIKKHMTPLYDVKLGLRQAFLVFDRDKSGYMNLSELQEVLCNIGEPLTLREAATVLEAVDVNQDGKVDVEEFVNFLCDKV